MSELGKKEKLKNTTTRVGSGGKKKIEREKETTEKAVKVPSTSLQDW